MRPLIEPGQLDLCRGAVFEDNTLLVQPFSPGEVVAMTAIIPIPHEGPMNVSVVQTSTNSVLGEALITFDSYADENLAQLTANNTAFSVTIPAASELPAGACTVAGDCVLVVLVRHCGQADIRELCRLRARAGGGGHVGVGVSGRFETSFCTGVGCCYHRISGLIDGNV